jgi:hypothetical protein
MLNADRLGVEKRRSAEVLQTQLKRPALSEEAIAVMADALEETGRPGAAMAFLQAAAEDDEPLPWRVQIFR